jgi:hypothetical protein
VNAIVRKDEAPEANMLTHSAVTPHDLLRIAIESNADLDRLERLMDLQDRYDANQARKAFFDGMTEFKKAAPEILKRKQVSFGSGDKKTEYMHATLFDVCDAIVADLAERGFTHRWKTKQADAKIAVTCIITHKLGHSEETTLESGADQSGGKNSIQAIASAVQYLERYTLLAGVGLTTKDMDDDGRKAAAQFIIEPQGQEIIALIESTKTNLPDFLKYMGVTEVMSILAKDYDKAILALKAKEAANKKKAAEKKA